MAENPGINPPERLAPHSVEAEEAVLGSILIDPSLVADIAVFLKPEDFFLVMNRWVYQAMLNISRRHEAVDTLTIASELDQQRTHGSSRLEMVGGIAHIMYLSNSTPTHIHAETYARIVERCAIRRRLLGAAAEIGHLALIEDVEIEDTLASAEKALLNAITRVQSTSLVRIGAVVNEIEGRWEYNQAHPDDAIKLETGFIDLDRKLKGGLSRGDIILLAGRPSTGKTALALNVATNAAQTGKTVAIFSAEMTKEQVTERCIAALASIDAEKLESGLVEEDDWSKYYNKRDLFNTLPIFIDDTVAITPVQIRAKLRELSRETQIDLVVVDYIGLMVTEDKPDNRVAMIGAISAKLKVFAREFDVPMLILAQLNRDLEKRPDKRPLLSDLRDSGSLEQDADVVIMLYRDDMYNESSERPAQVDLLIRKYRRGKRDYCTLLYQGQYTRFQSINQHNLIDFGDRS